MYVTCFVVHRALANTQPEKMAHSTKVSKPVLYIIQTGPQKGQLTTSRLCSMLNETTWSNILSGEGDELSVKNDLSSYSHIASVDAVAFKDKETLYIDYTLKKPLFILGNVYNAAVDLNGSIFEYAPYYSAKLPTLYIPSSEKSGRDCLENRVCSIVKTMQPLLSLLQEKSSSNIERVDLRQMFADTLGKKEIVITISYDDRRHILRFSPFFLESGINSYILLLKDGEYIKKESHIIDLRIDKNVFLEKL